jgi:Ca2+-binding EF-hand superfamily protein
MKRIVIAGLAVLSFSLVVGTALAQPGEGGKRKPPQGGEKKPGFGRPGFPPNPLVGALDTDKDGKISAEELKNAVAALKKLDKNNDGELTAEELRPAFGAGGPGFGGGGFGKQILEKLKAYDKNNDKKITKDEVPEGEQRIFNLADRNEDGVIDEAELQQLEERFSRGPGTGGKKRPKQDK